MRCWWAWVGRVRLGEQCRHKWKAMDKGLIGGIATNVSGVAEVGAKN